MTEVFSLRIPLPVHILSGISSPQFFSVFSLSGTISWSPLFVASKIFFFLLSDFLKWFRLTKFFFMSPSDLAAAIPLAPHLKDLGDFLSVSVSLPHLAPLIFTPHFLLIDPLLFQVIQ